MSAKGGGKACKELPGGEPQLPAAAIGRTVPGGLAPDGEPATGETGMEENHGASVSAEALQGCRSPNAR